MDDGDDGFPIAVQIQGARFQRRAAAVQGVEDEILDFYSLGRSDDYKLGVVPALKNHVDNLGGNEQNNIAVERRFQVFVSQARSRYDEEIYEHDADADRDPHVFVEDLADDVAAAGGGAAAEDQPQSDAEHEAAVDGRQHGVVRGRFQLENFIEKVDQQRGDDHAQQAAQAVLAAHDSDAEDKDRDVQHHDQGADRQTGEVINDDGYARHPAGDEVVRNQKQGVAHPHNSGTQDHQCQVGQVAAQVFFIQFHWLPQIELMNSTFKIIILWDRLNIQDLNLVTIYQIAGQQRINY